mgnify:CR=1 FL=1
MFLYQPETSAADLAPFGLTLDDVAQEDFLIWPDNMQALHVFSAMQTQWRYMPYGVSGSRATGLDYSALPEIWKRTGIPKKDRDDVFAALQVMEHAVLAELNKKRK